jgi:hypothetical protein
MINDSTQPRQKRFPNFVSYLVFSVSYLDPDSIRALGCGSGIERSEIRSDRKKFKFENLKQLLQKCCINSYCKP